MYYNEYTGYRISYWSHELLSWTHYASSSSLDTASLFPLMLSTPSGEVWSEACNTKAETEELRVLAHASQGRPGKSVGTFPSSVSDHCTLEGSWNGQWVVLKATVVRIQLPECCYNHFDTLLTNCSNHICWPSDISWCQQIDYIVLQTLFSSQWFRMSLTREYSSPLAAHQYSKCTSSTTRACSITLIVAQLIHNTPAIKLFSWAHTHLISSQTSF